MRDNEIVNPITMGIFLFTCNFTNIGRNRLLGNEVSNAWHMALELNEQATRDAQVIYGNSFTGPAERPRVSSLWTVQWDDGAGK